MGALKRQPAHHKLGTPFPPNSLLARQNEQTECHHNHADNHPVNRGVVFAGLDCCGQQFVQADEDHDAGDCSERDAERLRPRNGWRSKYPTMAPNGSARPDRVAHQAALRRDPVASRRGTATAMPSGMLWIAIATARGIARAGSASATANGQTLPGSCGWRWQRH